MNKPLNVATYFAPIGLAAAPLWAAKCTYLTETGFRYAALNFESPNVVIVRFFGIFFMIVHLGQVVGNAMSSSILRMNEDFTNQSGIFSPILRNSPWTSELRDDVDKTCGHFFDENQNLSREARDKLKRPDVQVMRIVVCCQSIYFVHDVQVIYSLYATYFCFTLVAMLVVVMFVDQLHMDVVLAKEKPRFKLDMWHKTLQHMRQPRHLLIIPLTIFNGMEQAFIAGEFTKARSCWVVLVSRFRWTRSTWRAAWACTASATWWPASAARTPSARSSSARSSSCSAACRCSCSPPWSTCSWSSRCSSGRPTRPTRPSSTSSPPPGAWPTPSGTPRSTVHFYQVHSRENFFSVLLRSMGCVLHEKPGTGICQLSSLGVVRIHHRVFQHAGSGYRNKTLSDG